MSALLRCPCGAVVDEDECPYPVPVGHQEWRHICCVNSECLWGVTAPTDAKAIAAWNTRSTPAPAVGDGRDADVIALMVRAKFVTPKQVALARATLASERQRPLDAAGCLDCGGTGKGLDTGYYEPSPCPACTALTAQGDRHE